MSTQLAYIAGLFDGEGSVSRYRERRKNRKNPTWVIRCEVNMTDRAIIKWLHKTLDFGSFHKKPPSKNQLGSRMQYRWCCSYRDALKFANLLFPYARVKRKKLQQIINHYDKLSLRYTDDRDVRVHHPVSRDGNHILKEPKTRLEQMAMLTHDPIVD
jgi:hypothetical protein